MKIISKFKDYYDFVAGVDTDSIIIYPRQFQKIIEAEEYNIIQSKQPHEITKFFKCEKKINTKLFFNVHKLNSSMDYNHGFVPRELGEFIFLSFCGKDYNIFKTIKNEYIYTLEEFIEKVDPKKELRFVKDYGKTWGYYEKHKNEFFIPSITKNNDLLNCPIVISYEHVIYPTPFHGQYVNQRLMDIQFNKVLNPRECYQHLYNWISEHKPEVSIPNSPDDMARYEAKGFDKKTSFRNTK